MKSQTIVLFAAMVWILVISSRNTVETASLKGSCPPGCAPCITDDTDVTTTNSKICPLGCVPALDVFVFSFVFNTQIHLDNLYNIILFKKAVFISLRSDERRQFMSN